MSTTQPTEGNLYRIDGAGEPLVFSRIGGTGLAIMHPPGEPDMQSSCAVEASRLVPVAPAADAWGEAHELAALERLFEIGLHGMKAFGSSSMTKAVRLAARATSTQEEFESALRNVMLFSPLSIRTEVAHVRRMVAERLAP